MPDPIEVAISTPGGTIRVHIEGDELMITAFDKARGFSVPLLFGSLERSSRRRQSSQPSQ